MRRKALALVTALWVFAQAVPFNGAAFAQADRAAAEQAIRKTLYELEYAYATGDAGAVKRLTAKRTLALYRLYFEALAPEMRPEADAPGGARGADDAGDFLLTLMLQTVSAGVGRSKSPEEIKEQARRNAGRAITMIDGRSAKVAGAGGEPPSLAVLEDGLWKIDDTEAVKEEFLKSPDLTPEVRKRIKEF